MPFFRTSAAVFALACASVCAQQSPAVTPSDKDKAAEAYLAGARFVDKNDLAAAQREFTRAAALDPTRRDYALALDVTRQHRVSELIQQAAKARLGDHPAEADSLIRQASLVDPASEQVREHLAADAGTGPTQKLQTPANLQITRPPELVLKQPIRLEPTSAAQDIHLRGSARQAFTQLTGAFGIKAAFDDSLNQTQAPDPDADADATQPQKANQPLRLDLEHTTYDQAVRILMKMTHLFATPLDTKYVLIARDTQENRARLERQFEETIYVPGSTTEQLNELTNVVKNVFDIKQAIVSANLGTLVLRAPEPTLKAVNATLKDLLDGGADVVLDIRLVTIDKNHTRNTGLNTPTSIQAFSVYAEAASLVTANQTVLQTAITSGALTFPTGTTAAQQTLIEAVFLLESGLATDVNLSGLLGTLGGGITLFGVSYLGNLAANFALSSSDSRALDDLSVRVGDRQTTVLRVGQKYPITTSTYSSGLTSATTAALSTATIGGVSVASLLAAASTATTPIIQYEDLGITLKTTPTVLKSGLVSIGVDLKIEALTGTSLDNIPILTSRNFVSNITVPEGTAAMMVSDLSRTEAASVSGIPGLADLPGFRQSAADTLKETDSSELILLVTPHLVRRRASLIAGPRIPFSTSVPQEF